MATPSTPVQLRGESVDAIVKHLESIFTTVGKNSEFRARLVEQDLLYYRETDKTQEQQRAAAANRGGNANKMQNVTVPVVGPQVDSAQSYFVEMFLTSYPVFPVIADPKYKEVATQLETMLGNSAVHFSWGREFALSFLDGLKHNIQAVEVDWVQETVPKIENDAAASVAFGTPKDTIFEGNKIKRLSPYNLLFDRRVPPSQVHKRGEFAGYVELLTRIELKQLFLDLDSSNTMNATKAFEAPTPGTTNNQSDGYYFIPEVNPGAAKTLSQQGFSWTVWGGLDTAHKINYQEMYEVATVYCRVIPKELKIYGKAGNKNAGDPQIYKFILVNRKVLVYAKRMTNAHNYLPIIIGQMREDGHGLQTKSYADNAAPFQQLASSLYNSALASQRRKVYDRLVYNSSLINKKDIDNADVVARIPMKSEAFARSASEAVYQIPFRDDGVPNILSIAREVVDMADISTGQNRVQRGQFQKGNKTRYEFDTVMQNSDSRPRTSAVLLGISWFQPIKDILKYNILQYQPPAELFNQQTGTSVKIDPTQLRNIAWEFKLADGIMPSDKYLNFELFGQALQFGMSVPQAAAEWDLMGMFAYQLEMQGARWVKDFRRTKEDAAAQMQTTMALQGKAPQQGTQQ